MIRINEDKFKVRSFQTIISLIIAYALVEITFYSVNEFFMMVIYFFGLAVLGVQYFKIVYNIIDKIKEAVRK